MDKGLTISKRKYYLYYSIIYIVVVGILYVPFFVRGKTFIAENDVLSQHFPDLIRVIDFINDNVHALLSGESFSQVDFKTFLGLDIIKTYNYYGLGNPLIFLIALINVKKTEIAYQLVVFSSIFIGGIAFSEYCFYHKKKMNYVLVACVLYITSPLVVSNIDTLCFIYLCYLIPIVFLGFDRLLIENKSILFSISICLTALNGFYFLYIISVALGMYYFYFMYNIEEKIHKKIKICFTYLKRIVLYYILGIGLSGIILFPCLDALFSSSRQGAILNSNNFLLYNMDFYKNELLSIFLYIQGKLITFNFAIIWIIILLIKERRKKETIIVGLFIICSQLGLVGYVFNGFSNPSPRWFMLFYFYIAYVSITVLENVKKENKAKMVLCIFIACVSLAQPLLLNIIYSSSNEVYSYKEVENIRNYVSPYDVNNMDVDITGSNRHNKFIYLNDSGLRIYNSLLPKKICDAMIDFGNAGYGNINEIVGFDSRIELEALFNIDYMIKDRVDNIPIDFEKIGDGFYKSKYSNCLGYTYDNLMSSKKNSISNAVSALYKGIVSGTDYDKDIEEDNEEYIKKIKFDIELKNDNAYKISFDKIDKSQVYLVIKNRGKEIRGNVLVDGIWKQEFNFFPKGSLYVERDKVYINVGCFDRISDFELRLSNEIAKEDIEVYSVDYDTLRGGIEQLYSCCLIEKSRDVNYVEGVIECKEDKHLCILMPNIKGWNVYVDGKKTRTYDMNYMFIGVDLKQGKHIIELKYKTPFLKEGIIVSVISALILLGILLKNKMIKR